MSEIFDELWNTTLHYKGLDVNIFGVPRFKNYNYYSIKTTLSRMKKNNFIKKDEKGWYITKEGKQYKEQNLSLKNLQARSKRSLQKILF